MLGTVLQVGDGRGFVIEDKTDRYVVTAAHCLSRLPEPFGGAGGDIGERTYADLLGPLGASPSVTAECVFVDLVADLAIFGQPDGQELYEQARAYRSLTDCAAAFPLGKLLYRRSPIRLSDGATISGPRKATSKARMLSLDGEWFDCRVTSAGRSLWVDDAVQPIRPGMSGSPIILTNGSAVGVVCVDGERLGGPNPILAASLPAWLVREA